MPVMNASMGGGTFTGTSTAPNMPFLGNQPAVYLAQLLNYRNRYGTPRSAPAAAAAPAPAPAATSDRYDPIQQQMEMETLRQKKIEDQALDAPAPTRTVSGPQIIPGQVMDPNAMSGIQRQIFLPKDNKSLGQSVGDQSDAAIATRTGEDAADTSSAVDRAKQLADLFSGSGDLAGATAMQKQDASDASDQSSKRLAQLAQALGAY